VPDRRRFRPVNVVYLHSIVYGGKKGNGRGCSVGRGRPGLRQLALGKGTARMGIRSHVRRAAFQERGSPYLNNSCLNILIIHVCVRYKKKNIPSVQVKI
jgi:hypothetical protein